MLPTHAVVSLQEWFDAEPDLACVMARRAMAELDAEEEGTPAAMFCNGPSTRCGMIPVTYDAERKKMLWYYFVGASMKSKELVRSL